MTSEKRLKLKENINSTAVKYSQAEKSSERKRYGNELAFLCLELYSGKCQQDSSMNEIMNKAVFKAMENWKPDRGASFTTFLHTVINNERNDYIRFIEHDSKRRCGDGTIYNFSINDNGGDDDGGDSDDDSKIRTEETIGDKLPDFSVKLDADDMFMMLLDAVKVAYNNRSAKKTCYTVYFFTETVSQFVYDGIYIPSEGKMRQAEPLMQYDFANTYMTKPCSSVADFMSSDLRPLCEFRPNADKSKKCGFKLDNIVYAGFFGVSESAVSQQRDKYDMFRKSIRDKMEH